MNSHICLCYWWKTSSCGMVRKRISWDPHRRMQVFVVNFILIFLFYPFSRILFHSFFRERGREREKHWCMREALIGCFLYTHGLRFEPTTWACVLTRDDAPTNWAIPARACGTLYWCKIRGVSHLTSQCPISICLAVGKVQSCPQQGQSKSQCLEFLFHFKLQFRPAFV